MYTFIRKFKLMSIFSLNGWHVNNKSHPNKYKFTYNFVVNCVNLLRGYFGKCKGI